MEAFMDKAEVKNFDRPDAVRTIPKGRLELIKNDMGQLKTLCDPADQITEDLSDAHSAFQGRQNDFFELETPEGERKPVKVSI
jgi:hypothetical protein